MNSEFCVRYDCRNRRFTGCKSRFLQEVDGAKGTSSAAAELCGVALTTGSKPTSTVVRLTAWSRSFKVKAEKNLLERFTNGDASARMECAGFWRTEARLRDHSDGSFAYGDEPDHKCKWRRIP